MQYFGSFIIYSKGIQYAIHCRLLMKHSPNCPRWWNTHVRWTKMLFFIS